MPAVVPLVADSLPVLIAVIVKLPDASSASGSVSSWSNSCESEVLRLIVASSFTASVSFIRSAPFPIIVIVKVEVSVPPCVSLVVNVNISVTVSPLLRDAASFAI